MRNPYSFQVMCLLLSIVALTGCKKNVVASPPTAQPAQPAVRPIAPTITLRTAVDTIDRGQATSLQWEAKNAITVRIDPEIGIVQNEGLRSVSPTSSVTYTATAIGPGGSVADSVRVTVRVPSPTPARAPSRSDASVSIVELFKQNVQTIYFDYDKADIRTDQLQRLQADAAWLQEHPGLRFTIVGNSDERGSEEYNLGLGDRRAGRVKDFLTQHGVDQSTANTISYGEERPVCKELTEQCYQQNRRAEFVASPAN